MRFYIKDPYLEFELISYSISYENSNKHWNIGHMDSLNSDIIIHTDDDNSLYYLMLNRVKFDCNIGNNILYGSYISSFSIDMNNQICITIVSDYLKNGDDSPHWVKMINREKIINKLLDK